MKPTKGGLLKVTKRAYRNSSNSCLFDPIIPHGKFITFNLRVYRVIQTSTINKHIMTIITWRCTLESCHRRELAPWRRALRPRKVRRSTPRRSIQHWTCTASSSSSWMPCRGVPDHHTTTLPPFLLFKIRVSSTTLLHDIGHAHHRDNAGCGTAFVFK